MSDITRCTDIKCPSKDKCYRQTAAVDYQQSYADFNRETDAAQCEHFWPTGQATKEQQQ